MRGQGADGFFLVCRQNPESRILSAIYRYGAPRRIQELAAFLETEKRETAWRRDVAEGIRRLCGMRPGTRAKEIWGKNGADDAQSAARIRADVLAMLEGEKE